MSIFTNDIISCILEKIMNARTRLIYLLFRYIASETIGFEAMFTPHKQQGPAKIISELHRYGSDVPVPTQNYERSRFN
ncbi:hypothetical protein FACS1894122_12960 [Alphaproteobacteria bacterium]|nr:hypothetical protein FACS1894122_12960 [Alphaproteobacteria bacterium]